nr:MAG TPA: hypothetical protein [Caudoviricetes sp.]DAY71030.1 MAG TPA: hypothetical protein [Caudoviricetes sp.]
MVFQQLDILATLNYFREGTSVVILYIINSTTAI